MTVFDAVAASGVIPVTVIDDAGSAVAVGEALLAGGVPCIEVTFRTEAAAESIERLTQAFPEMMVGAGTVLTIDQAEAATRAGSRFIVSPVVGKITFTGHRCPGCSARR